MMLELSDAELVGQIGSGECAAEAELFRRMAPRIRLYGVRHLRDVDAANDLAQQVLIKTLEV
jgi:RNA polymerase sigma-70 factor, ECF subfamily